MIGCLIELEFKLSRVVTSLNLTILE